MNKEEIDNLENYLKNDLPKIEPTIPIANFGSVDLEDLMSSIKQFKKVPTSDELLRENKRLRSQLEEKDKIIEEINNRCNQEISAATLQYEKHKRNDTWQYLIAHKRILEILERGKNVNSK